MLRHRAFFMPNCLPDGERLNTRRNRPITALPDTSSRPARWVNVTAIFPCIATCFPAIRCPCPDSIPPLEPVLLQPLRSAQVLNLLTLLIALGVIALSVVAARMQYVDLTETRKDQPQDPGRADLRHPGSLPRPGAERASSASRRPSERAGSLARMRADKTPFTTASTTPSNRVSCIRSARI